MNPFLLIRPDGLEWALFVFAACLFIALAFFAAFYYSRYRKLRKKLDNVQWEKDVLLKSLKEMNKGG